MFNVGEVVKCVNLNNPEEDKFTIGKIYVVLNYKDYGNNEQWNSVAGDDGNLYIVNHHSFHGMFELQGNLSSLSKEELDIMTMGYRSNE